MIYVGIDTGVHTGLAVWDSDARRFLDIQTMPLHRALFYIIFECCAFESFTVVVEDARKRKWIPREGSVKEMKGRAMGAGSVKRDAKIWEEFCSDNGFPLMTVPPQKGATKWSAKTFGAVTGWRGRTSHHARDAALLVFGR